MLVHEIANRFLGNMNLRTDHPGDDKQSGLQPIKK